MSPPRETPPAGEQGTLYESVTSPNSPQTTTRPRQKATQYERVLRVLLERDEVCGTELYAMYIPRFGAHLHRMKKNGWIWSKRPCDRHDWHEGTQYLYRLDALPYEIGGPE